MKNMFKLAAIAVSMALVMSLVACSSGDDDVVDATTPKYLVTAQIEQYVASIEYDQNVSDREIKSLKNEHDAMMGIVGNCEKCLAYYFGTLKCYMDNWEKDESSDLWYKRPVTSNDVEKFVDNITYVKTNFNTEEKYHKEFVYKNAIRDALADVDKAEDKVQDIVVAADKKLNERQAENMNAYIDAVKALKAALSKTDSDKCKDTIKTADEAIKAFNDLKEVKEGDIDNVTAKVEAMVEYIRKNILNESTTPGGNDDGDDEQNS